MRACPICQTPDPNFEISLNGKDFFQCKKCKFVYSAETAASELNVVNNKSWEAQEKNRRAIEEKRVELIRTLKSDGRLLDIGCGRGFFIKSAVRYGYKVEGLESIHLAAKEASEYLDAVIHVSDIQNSLTIEENFDIITMWETLEYFTDPLEALKNVKTLLKPDGILLAETLNNKILKHSDILESMPFTPNCFFGRQSLHLLFEKSGFLNIEPLHISYENGGIIRQGVEFLQDKLNNSFYLGVYASIYD